MKIQEFSFGNFKSFKEIQTLNLSAAKITSKNKEIDSSNVIAGDNNEGVSFLKSKAIYGANASGKSNVVKAFKAFVSILKSSVKDENILKYIDQFKLSSETEKEPCFFQLVFWLNDVKYRYGFEADQSNIKAEWLYGKPNEREIPFFIRENQTIIELDKTNFSEGDMLTTLLGDDSDENDIFRNNSLFLSTLATFGFGRISKQLIKSVSLIIIITGLGDKEMDEVAIDALNDNKKQNYILDLLKHGDIGIENIMFTKLPSNVLLNNKDKNEAIIKKISTSNEKKVLLSVRKRFNEKLEHEYLEAFFFDTHESEGTKKLFELSSFIYDAIKEGLPIIIDEFDARFHPLLTKKIVELFNSNENKGSQLIVTTHDTNLLSSDLLRRDQIEFVEKDKYGASHLYSLTQFKGIRNTASFEKDYIQGKYGAIPFLGDFTKLFNLEEDA